MKIMNILDWFGFGVAVFGLVVWVFLILRLWYNHWKLRRRFKKW